MAADQGDTLAGVRKNSSIVPCSLAQGQEIFSILCLAGLIPPEPDGRSANAESSPMDGLELKDPLITWCGKTLTTRCSFPSLCSPSHLCLLLTFCSFLSLMNLFSDSLFNKSPSNAASLSSQLQEGNRPSNWCFRKAHYFQDSLNHLLTSYNCNTPLLNPPSLLYWLLHPSFLITIKPAVIFGDSMLHCQSC